MRAPEGYSVEREGAHAVALDLAIDEELRARGPRARDRARGAERAQDARACRSRTGSSCALDGDAALLAAADAHRDYLAGETLATTLRVGGEDAPRLEYTELAQIDGLELSISLGRAPAAPG